MRPGPSFHFTLDLVTFRTCCHTFSGLSVHCHPRNIPFPHVGASICGVPCLFYGLYPSLWGALHLVDSRKLCHGTGLGEMLLPQPTRRWGELPPALPLRLTPTTGTFWEAQHHGATELGFPCKPACLALETSCSWLPFEYSYLFLSLAQVLPQTTYWTNV